MNRLTLEILNLPKYQPQEVCWETGLYNDDCICELCEHYYECMYGSEDEEE